MGYVADKIRENTARRNGEQWFVVTMAVPAYEIEEEFAIRADSAEDAIQKAEAAIPRFGGNYRTQYGKVKGADLDWTIIDARAVSEEEASDYPYI